MKYIFAFLLKHQRAQHTYVLCVIYVLVFYFVIILCWFCSFSFCCLNTCVHFAFDSAFLFFFDFLLRFFLFALFPCFWPFFFCSFPPALPCCSPFFVCSRNPPARPPTGPPPSRRNRTPSPPATPPTRQPQSHPTDIPPHPRASKRSGNQLCKQPRIKQQSNQDKPTTRPPPFCATRRATKQQSTEQLSERASKRPCSNTSQ